jgi:hypothetical protein
MPPRDPGVLDSEITQVLGRFRRGEVDAIEPGTGEPAGWRSGQLEDAHAEVAAAEDRLAQVKRDYANGDLTAAEWREVRTELEAERDAATASVDRLYAQAGTMGQQIDAAAADGALMAQIARMVAVVRAGLRTPRASTTYGPRSGGFSPPPRW